MRWWPFSEKKPSELELLRIENALLLQEVVIARRQLEAIGVQPVETVQVQPGDQVVHRPYYWPEEVIGKWLIHTRTHIFIQHEREGGQKQIYQLMILEIIYNDLPSLLLVEDQEYIIQLTGMSRGKGFTIMQPKNSLRLVPARW